MDVLNDEVLTEIFKYLPSSFRRESIGLVCRRWNQICKSYNFTKDELITITNAYDLRTALSILKSDQRRVFNLYFVHKQLFWNNDYSFWTSCGERVQSIYLKNIHSSILDVIKVIQLCPRVKNIKLKCTSPEYVSKLLRKFNTVVEMNFIAPSVTCLHLLVQDCSANKVLTNYHLQKIFSIFPGLTDVQLIFNYKIDCIIGINPASDEINSNTNLSLFAVISMLSDLIENLQKLSIKTGNPSYYCFCPRSPNFRPLHGDVTSILLKCKKLHELKFPCFFSFMGPDIAQPNDPFFNLTQMTALHLHMGYITTGSVAKFMSLVLDAFSDLQDLRLKCIRSLEIDASLIQKLLSSTLNFLKLEFETFTLETSLVEFRDFRVNRTLKTMSICSLTLGEEFDIFFSILVQHFQNVDDLTVYHPNDTILQFIFKYQDRLKKLRLELCSSCSDVGFTGISDHVDSESEVTTYCIAVLSDLEYLQISPVNQLTEKTFKCFVFPKLKTLKLTEFDHSEMSLYVSCSNKFAFFIENSPFLEKLKLSFSNMLTQEELEELLRRFTHLRYLSIFDDSPLGVGLPKLSSRLQFLNLFGRCRRRAQLKYSAHMTYSYETFFDICPSLRKFIHNSKTLVRLSNPTNMVGFNKNHIRLLES